MATNNPFSQDNPTLSQPQPSIPQLPSCVLQRAKGLKLMLIAEMFFVLFILFQTTNLLPILILVPTNIVGFYGAQQFRVKLLTIFVYLKSIIVTFMSVYVVFEIIDVASCRYYCSNTTVPLIVLSLITLAQVLCVVVANRLKCSLLSAQTYSSGTVELGDLEGQPTAASPQQTPQNAPVYPYPYPMPYMPQPPQGFSAMPYAYPEYPVNGQQGQPPMHAVYPTYMYSPEAQQQFLQQQQQQQLFQQQQQQQNPTYTFTPEVAAPTNKDSEPLI